MHVYLTIRIIGTFYISSLRIKTTEILCCATVLYFKQQHSRVAAQPCLDYTGIMCICTFTILEGTIVFEHGSLVSACMAIQLLYTFLPIRLYVCIAVHTYIHICIFKWIYMAHGICIFNGVRVNTAPPQQEWFEPRGQSSWSDDCIQNDLSRLGITAVLFNKCTWLSRAKMLH